eukprot:TRINITY_DN4866_c0_g1_i1.p1 TRINITY_DN4866_c0_g1~~TRINITY_DN4866_c0_g1_i1.p1  ORF type:complete len:807 (+),score=191.51 TRINITY_DN4866_c0_g1_i1:192-2612(+)
MSFFKKFTKGSSEKDKKEEKNDAKRKQTLVAELQKSSGLSVAFMTELKQKTEAIRLLKLENDEWSDDEDVPAPVGVDASVAPTPSPSQGLSAAAKGEKKLDLKAVAARMGFKKRPQKDDDKKKKFWNQAGSKSSLRRKLHERYLEAPDQQNQVIKEASQLAHHKAANRLTIMEQRRLTTQQKPGSSSAPIPRSAPGTLRSAINTDDLSSEESTNSPLSSSPSNSRSGSVDKAGLIPISIAIDRPSSPLKRNRSGTTMVVITSGDKDRAGPQRSTSDREMSVVIKASNDGKPPLIVPAAAGAAPIPKPLTEPSAAPAKPAEGAATPADNSHLSVSSEDVSPRTGEEKPKKKKKPKKSEESDASGEPNPPKDKDKEKKKKKKRSPSFGELEKSKSDISLVSSSSASNSAPLFATSVPRPEPLPAQAQQHSPETSPREEQRSHSMPTIASAAHDEPAESPNEPADPALELLRQAAAKLGSPGAATASSIKNRPVGGRAAVSANSTLRREIDVAAGKTVELTRRLGKGSFGTVWAGVLNGRQIALKQISLDDLPKDKKAQLRQQVKKELELVKPLRHDGILRYYGMFFSKERQEASLVMELVDGVSLSDLIAFQTKLPEKLAALILRQVVDSLEYLHGNFIIHRDLKPDNILMDSSGRSKLIDFGCAASVIPEQVMKRRSTVGTPWYCSPEVVNCDEYDFRADIWSVGCSAIELVTGKPPYDDLNDIACLFKMAEGAPPPLPDGISEECRDFLVQTLRPDPRERPDASTLLSHPFLALSAEEIAMTTADLRTLVTEMNNQRRKLAEEDEE